MRIPPFLCRAPVAGRPQDIGILSFLENSIKFPLLIFNRIYILSVALRRECGLGGDVGAVREPPLHPPPNIIMSVFMNPATV